MTKRGILLEKLNKLRKYKKSNQFYAEQLQISVEEVRELLQELRGKDNNGSEESEFSQRVNNEKGTIESTVICDFLPKNDDELAKLHKVNLDKFRISSYYSKQRGKKFTSTVLCTRIRCNDTEAVIKDWSKFLSGYKSSYKPISRSQLLVNTKLTRKSCLLVSMADFHLDKRDLNRTPIEKRVELYKEVVDTIVCKAYMSHLIDEIVYTVGNDFLHTDTYFNTTTNGTPQDTNASWNDAYEIGFGLQVETISRLRQFCNKLTIIHIPSNHSKTKEYFLAHALSVFFKADNSIVFDRTAEPAKVFIYGNNFIGFIHGDTPIEKIPSYFSSKFYKEWGKCRYKEIALGDKHHTKKWKYSMDMTGGEVEGVRMFICPSLSEADQWHRDKLYTEAIKASTGRIYDYEKGYCNEIEERIS